MRQMFHLYFRDLKRCRWEAAALLAAMALWAAWEGHRPEFVSARNYAGFQLARAAGVVIPAMWVYLLWRVVWHEAPAGDRQWWVTRPCSRWSVVGARVMFLLTVICAPKLAADAAVLHVAGLDVREWAGQLAARQAGLVAAALVAAALAAVTRGFRDALLGLLAGAGFVAAALSRWEFNGWLREAQTRWIGEWLTVGILAAAALAALAVQYASRRTRVARVALAAGLVAGVAVWPLLTEERVWRIQNAVLEAPAFGVIRLETYCDDPEWFDPACMIWIDRPAQGIEISQARGMSRMGPGILRLQWLHTDFYWHRRLPVGWGAELEAEILVMRGGEEREVRAGGVVTRIDGLGVCRKGESEGIGHVACRSAVGQVVKSRPRPFRPIRTRKECLESLETGRGPLRLEPVSWGPYPGMWAFSPLTNHREAEQFAQEVRIVRMDRPAGMLKRTIRTPAAMPRRYTGPLKPPPLSQQQLRGLIYDPSGRPVYEPCSEYP